ncbi:chromate resistance protein ChrB domain-containing protein [Falsiroseomonas tokyonensis]|uniref:Chromate resistance protein ChrB domain-containing protein n=1 Tax=Falsiroseomonas tokyonensis TaxID=430521 RepID=A0ABV7BQA5_9PROT|nr:sulfurtransferase/chromate resistance protein [Falsiroseomonas tokyonensis]MBU8537794.1 chromate resistance protein [Falsiroseomonas tokyonensis]
MLHAPSISPEDLFQLLGQSDAPHLIDVRVAEHVAEDPRSLPAARPLDYRRVDDWAPSFQGQRVVVICQHGLKLSEGAAAWLRHAGAEARSLAGGFVAWRDAGLPLFRHALLPPRDAQGRTLWVTRSRPKVDRIACPWLIRRFIDRQAVFLFTAPSEVSAVADRFGATPFDIDGVFWSHRGETCSFDTMLAEFGLESPALQRLALLVRGADTARPELAPECAGLLAASLGLSRLHGDDLAQLEAGLALYDSFYLWCRDATEEVHNWPAQNWPTRSAV